MKATITHGVAVVVAVVATWAATELNRHPALQNFVDREAVVIRHLGFACGVERWSVKTLTDTNASQINLTNPKRTNVPTLVAIPPTGEGARTAPAETTVWQLTGVHVVAFKQEPDSDIHLKLQSVLVGHPTMIAEIPDPSCVNQSSPARDQIGTARAALLRYALAKGLTLSGSYQTVDWPVTLRGIGFFDFLHGQNGVAANGIELHPVIFFHGH